MLQGAKPGRGAEEAHASLPLVVVFGAFDELIPVGALVGKLLFPLMHVAPFNRGLDTIRARKGEWLGSIKKDLRRGALGRMRRA